jgi:hypothetical protein
LFLLPEGLGGSSTGDGDMSNANYSADEKSVTVDVFATAPEAWLRHKSEEKQ